jgi:hypothetical protein
MLRAGFVLQGAGLDAIARRTHFRGEAGSSRQTTLALACETKPMLPTLLSTEQSQAPPEGHRARVSPPSRDRVTRRVGALCCQRRTLPFHARRGKRHSPRPRDLADSHVAKRKIPRPPINANIFQILLSATDNRGAAQPEPPDAEAIEDTVGGARMATSAMSKTGLFPAQCIG